MFVRVEPDSLIHYFDRDDLKKIRTAVKDIVLDRDVEM